MKLITWWRFCITKPKTVDWLFLGNYDQIWAFCSLIHIFITNNPIFKCNTSICRYSQLLHFVYLLWKRLTYFWGRYDQNTENFSRFTLKSTFTVLQLLLHELLQLHFHFRLVSDFKVSSRNIIGIFYIVACNYSRLVIIIILLFLLSGNFFAVYLLRDYHSHHYQTSLQHRPYVWATYFQL